MENLEFTDDEIREQLANLGYFDVSETRLKQFRKDLQRLVEHDRSSGSSSWFTGITSPSTSSDASPSSQQHRRSPKIKPSLSRYQPHIQVSPRPADSSTYGEFSRMPQTSQESSPLGVSHHSPETRLKTLTLTDNPPPSGSDESPLSNQGQDYTETATASRDPMYDIPSTSYSRQNVTDDITRRHGESEDLASSYRRFLTTDDVTPETPSTGVSPEPPTSSERRVLRRRKVMRKQENGESVIFDESLVADGDTSYRIHDMSVDDMNISYDRVRLPPTLPPRPHTARPNSKRFSDQESTHEPLPSYIRPNTSHPHTRNIRKTDPVNRFHQYRDAWNSIKAPGEKSHSALRWEVKAQMMYKDEPQPKPQKIYIPNTYVVPTSKKRSALRWEVRHALEHGMPVPSTYTVI